MTKTNIITIISFVILLVAGFFILMFWKIGVFKESYQPSPLLEKIQNQLEFIKNYDLKAGQKILQDLSVEKVELPKIQETELGRPSLFSNP